MNSLVFLTGFMAAGKSKVGRLLAQKVGHSFVDTDDMIQERVGLTISEIFSQHGEEAFRELEYECVCEVADFKNFIIALGGGAIIQERIRETIRKSTGLLVYLEVDSETVLERIRGKKTRPLLAGLTYHQMREKIEIMLSQRAPFYAAADVTVPSMRMRSAAEVATEIEQCLGQHFKCKQ